MNRIPATFECEARMWHRFTESCARRGEHPATLLADFVRLTLKSWDRPAKRELATDERLLALLRLLVAEALAASRSWAELAHHLDARNLTFELSGGGLILRDAASGRRLCKASEAGPSYARLIRRFGRHPADKRQRPQPLRRAA